MNIGQIGLDKTGQLTPELLDHCDQVLQYSHPHKKRPAEAGLFN